MPAVGWIPLAPFEVYHPYYRTSVTYVRNVNITSVNRTVINNITNVTVVNRTTVVNNYANQRAATVVPSAAFTRAAPVHRAALDVPHDELARARVVPTVEHLPPTVVARTGVAIPAAAEMHVPQPHAPASIARTPVREFAPPGRAEPSVPTSPGPEFGHRLDRNGPPRAAFAPPPQRDAAPSPAPHAVPAAPQATRGAPPPIAPHRDAAPPARGAGARRGAPPRRGGTRRRRSGARCGRRAPPGRGKAGGARRSRGKPRRKAVPPRQRSRRPRMRRRRTTAPATSTSPAADGASERCRASSSRPWPSRELCERAARALARRPAWSSPDRRSGR